MTLAAIAAVAAKSPSKNMLLSLPVLFQCPGGKDRHSDQACHHPWDGDAEVATEMVLCAEDDGARALDLIPGRRVSGDDLAYQRLGGRDSWGLVAVGMSIGDLTYRVEERKAVAVAVKAGHEF